MPRRKPVKKCLSYQVVAATDGVFDNLFDHQVGSQGWNDVGMFPVDTNDPIGLSGFETVKFES